MCKEDKCNAPAEGQKQYFINKGVDMSFIGCIKGYRNPDYKIIKELLL